MYKVIQGSKGTVTPGSQGATKNNKYTLIQGLKGNVNPGSQGATQDNKFKFIQGSKGNVTPGSEGATQDNKYIFIQGSKETVRPGSQGATEDNFKMLKVYQISQFGHNQILFCWKASLWYTVVSLIDKLSKMKFIHFSLRYFHNFV